MDISGQEAVNSWDFLLKWGKKINSSDFPAGSGWEEQKNSTSPQTFNPLDV